METTTLFSLTLLTLLVLAAAIYYNAVPDGFNVPSMYVVDYQPGAGLLDNYIINENPKLEATLPTICKQIDTGKALTDTEFLEYMIPHHQVAVDICKSMSSDNQLIRELCRQLIWQQGYEITLMHAMINRLPDTFSKEKALAYYNQSLYDFYNPPSLALVNQPVCKPNNFTEHKFPQLDDTKFLEHMVAHHAIAVKMAKNQMRETKNSYIMSLCYDLIHQQEIELVKMQEMIANQMWKTSVMLS